MGNVSGRHYDGAAVLRMWEILERRQTFVLYIAVLVYFFMFSHVAIETMP